MDQNGNSKHNVMGGLVGGSAPAQGPEHRPTRALYSGWPSGTDLLHAPGAPRLWHLDATDGSCGAGLLLAWPLALAMEPPRGPSPAL